MELEKKLELLESKLIDALAEAKAARIIAEKALSQSAAPSLLGTSDPWTEPVEQTTNPFIKEVDVSPRPTLSSFSSSLSQPKAPEGDGIKILPDEEEGLEDEFWDEAVGEEQNG